jgi:hypothetical protein
MQVVNLMRRAMLFTVVLAGLVGGVADSASATTFSGQISDPVEHPADRARDITNVATTFDNATGRWTVIVTFAGAPTAATSARLYTAIFPPRAQCPLGAGALGLELETSGTLGRYNQTCRQGTPQSMQRSLNGSVLTLQVSDPAAIGLAPVQLGQTRLSEHRIYDLVPATRLFAPTAAATLGVGPGTRFRISHAGTLSLPLSGVSRTAHASVRLVASGTLLARRTLTVKPGMARLQLHLAGAARPHIRAGGTEATLQSKLTDAAGHTRTVTQKISLIK